MKVVKEKECATCKILKTVESFHKTKNNGDGLCTQCKDCRRTRTKLHYELNKERIKTRTSKYYVENKEKISKQKLKYQKNREENDVLYKMQRRLRNRLYYALEKNTWKKDTSFSKYIGCELDELKVHLEVQFQPGMTWDNYGKWHIDHILALTNAKDEAQLLDLSHYKNLRPMWADANLSKGDRSDICWQKLQRDRLIDEDLKTGCPTDTKARDYVLTEESFTSEHRKFIERYEWLGDIGFGVRRVFTARYNGILGGVILIAEPNSYQFGIEKEALIQRGACASWTPKNLGSRLVMFSCNWMVQNTEKRIFVAYSDPEAGEIGTIYQACNFDFLGQNFGSDYEYNYNGEWVGSRHFTRTSSMKKWAKELGIQWDKSWIKENGFQDIKSIPKDKLKQLRQHGYSLIKSCPKRKKKKKGKYVLLLTKGKERIEKTWTPKLYPKRNKV